VIDFSFYPHYGLYTYKYFDLPTLYHRHNYLYKKPLINDLAVIK